MNLLRLIALTLCLVGISSTYAYAGTIDPRGVGNWKALFENTALSSAPTLNFGKFTTQSSYNITVSDTELRGYVWGEGVGWIVVNCADTTSGCSGTNGNFKVANDGAGTLSGYAWGENTGWINFGPFTNSAISRVKITSGLFGGTLGDAGYAWAENYGWIKFDCSNPASCVETDWRPATPPGGGGGGGGGGRTQCSDGGDNDGDGLIDSADPGCHFDGDATNPASYVPSDTDETNTVIPVLCPDGSLPVNGVCGGKSLCDLNPDECIGPIDSYVCSNGEDDDRDGKIDFAGGDPGCSSPTDMSEEDPQVPFCTLNPSDPSCIGATFCELNPTDPSCRTILPGLCDLIPTFPTCLPGGPGEGVDPEDFAIPVTPDNPIVRSLTWLGLSLPIASAIASSLFSNPIALKDLPLVLGQLWNSVLIALGWKQRRKPWGVVYDSVTKQPIDPAYVVLMDMTGNEVATAITDMEGRYGFAVDPGTYTIVANKTNYQFPSTKLAGKESDGLYDDLYFGGEVVVSKEGDIITKNIPLDALAFDWNEYAKAQGNTHGMKLSFYRKSDIVLYYISRALFMIGFAYAIYAFLFYPTIYNTIILVLYIILALIQTFSPRFYKKGSVLSKNGKQPLPFSVVRIISAVTNQEIARKVADRLGNYYGLVQNGLYTFAIDVKKPAEEGYDKHPVDTYVKVKKGYLKETFKV